MICHKVEMILLLQQPELLSFLAFCLEQHSDYFLFIKERVVGFIHIQLHLMSKKQVRSCYHFIYKAVLSLASFSVSLAF